MAAILFIAGSPARAQDEDARHFEERIRPVLLEHCVGCHGEKDAMGDLRVDSRAELLEGGASGPSIVPGDPEASLILRAIRHEGAKLAMPMDAPPLQPRQIQDFESWIRAGASWPGPSSSTPTSKMTEQGSPVSSSVMRRTRSRGRAESDAPRSRNAFPNPRAPWIRGPA